MNEIFGYLATLPGTPAEQAWLQERLETLSEWESLVLTVEEIRSPPTTAAEAIRTLCFLESGMVISSAAGYEGLGEHKLHSMEGEIPEELAEYIDLRALGRQFEDEHLGLFIDHYYVAYPAETGTIQQNLFLPETGWSVKLKLASPTKPEGVWLRLPDYSALEAPGSIVGETGAAQRALQVESLDDCVLLEARCILPEAGNVIEQYDKISDLVQDGNNLGFILDEKGQGKPHFDELYAAALEYEDCRTLRYALDISQNLRCYEWVPCDGLKDFAVDHLRSRGVSEALIQSGVIDFKGYAEDLLETSGYMLTRNESGYVARNTRKFTFEYCTQEEADGLSTRHEGQPSSEEPAEEYVLPENILDEFPRLASLAARASPFERKQAELNIREALEGRGPEALRQLQAAMECEDCADLKAAAAIAEDLGRYDFIEVGSFQENAKKELMEKGLSEQVIGFCFDFDTYAAITHNFESIFHSTKTGLYVHFDYNAPRQVPQQEQSGMAGQSM